MFDENQLPPSPRRITEISFTSFPQKLEALEKLDDGKDRVLKGKLFWLRITRDMTKINEMQNVFKYLRYAELVPAIKKIQVRCFFQKWKQAFTAKKWIHIANKVRVHTRLTEFQSNADRIVKVRVKFAKNNYLKNHPFVPDFSFLSGSATKTRVAPLQDLVPIVLPPPKEEYEYEEDEEEAEAEDNELIDDIASQSSTKQAIKQTPTRNETQTHSTRNIEVESQIEEDIIDDVKEEEKQQEQPTEEEEQQEQPTEEEEQQQPTEEEEKKEEPILQKPETAEKKSKSKLWIILLGLLVTAILASFVFCPQFQRLFRKSPDPLEPTEPLQPTEIPQITEAPVADQLPETKEAL